MSIPTSIPELVIQFLEHLSLTDIISAMHVNQQWRALVPCISSPIRLRLLSLAFRDGVQSPYPISIEHRQSYVHKVELKHEVVIPEPYRTILMEWPSSQPPPEMHWPHSVRFHATGFCYCPRHMYDNPDECRCADEEEVQTVSIMLPKDVLMLAMEEGRADKEKGWELFDNAPRLHTDAQNRNTIRFIRQHPIDEFPWKFEVWASLQFTVLDLSSMKYYPTDAEDRTSDGHFVMMLDGPTRGQIHAWSWSGSSWYDGLEAEDFWDWKYVEWDYNAPNVGSNTQATQPVY
ncbi:hypothetical protein C8J57DRAFT_41421 [Mycena rebaudengoi]|nr:hypothetical protein C8J57DRAFT_41421 [Mycena rebaudengoi]